jgi:ribonuclease BN (tRNA processing enzyme)
MRLTVVGCSGSFPGPDSPASCYLVEAPWQGREYRLLLDLGSGALGALQSHVPLESIDALALSHLHPDHCLDLCGYYVVRKYNPSGPMPPLPVYAPGGASARLARAYDLHPDDGMAAEFDFVTFTDEPVTLGPFQLTVTQVEHPIQAYAIRVSDGERTLVYTGDTAPCRPLEELAKGADVLLSEASFLEGVDNPKGLHMTGKDAAELAHRAGVGRLLLTHIPPWYSRDEVVAQARPYFSGDTAAVLPGARYQI